MTRVPLERRSTARIALSFFAAVVLPIAIFTAILGYLMWEFSDAFGDLLKSLPF